ncbi:MAG: hypothetical protein ACI3XR_04435 [Eubacteriales bacterium]
MTDRKDLIWRSIGQIGDDLVEQAEESRVRTCFASYRRRKRLCSAISACLVLGFGLILALRLPFSPKNGSASPDDGGGMGNSSGTVDIPKGDNPPIRITLPDPSDPGCGSNLWDNSLKVDLSLDKSVYAPDEIPVMELTFGLADDALGEGSLRIVIDPDTFTTPIKTEWTFEYGRYTEHPEGGDRLTVPLIRDENTANGTVTVSFWFYPSEDSDAEIPEEGVRIGWVGLPYTCDEQGIAFTPYSTGEDSP